MKRLWISLALTSLVVYISPIILAYTGLLVFVACGIMTMFKKFVKKNTESLMALFLSCVYDIVKHIVIFTERIGVISEVERMRLPNYLTLLLKAHPDVQSEQVEIIEGSVRVIVYHPKVIRNNGVIVYCHGGGWVMLTARMFHHAVSWLAHEHQMVTVSVDYRSPPEYIFPRPLEDVYNTVLWAQRNSDKLGVDPTKVVLMGDSAGGNLAAAAVLVHMDKREDHALPPIAAQVLIYPVLQSYNYLHGSYVGRSTVDLQKYVSYYLAGDVSLYGKVGNPEAYDGYPAYWSAVVDTSTASEKRLTPHRRLSSSPDNLSNVYCFPLLDTDPRGLPPTYVFALTRDAIKDDAVHYTTWLRHHGVLVEYAEDAQSDHGSMFMYGTDASARDNLRDIAKFVWAKVE